MWNDRLLPHPLLTPWTDDYGSAEFRVNVPHAVLNNGKQINLTIKYHLTSQYLRDIINNGSAQFVGILVCSKTFSRESHPTNSEDDVYTLNAGDYGGDLRLTPYVVSTKRIEAFNSNEFADEFKTIRPEGFSISPGSILAVGVSMIIVLEEGGSPSSVIDLVPDSKVQMGSFLVSLDDNRIKIHVEPEEKKKIEAFRQRGQGSREMAVLFPSVYLHAVTEALRNLGDYPDTHWALTMKKALEKHNIEYDLDDMNLRALTYAQKLMEMPMGTLLKVFDTGEEE